MALTEALLSVERKMGFHLTESELEDLLDQYDRFESDQLKKRLGFLKAEWRSLENSVEMDEIEIVLTAREVMNKSRMAGAQMGLHTEDERVRAREMAKTVFRIGKRGGRTIRAQSQGYIMAIRDLAKDEGAMDFVEEMERMLLELK